MSRPVVVSPLQVRFVKGVLGLIAVEALVFQVPGAVLLALVLAALEIAGPPWSPLGWVFRVMARPSARLQVAARVRFSLGIGLVALGAAAVLLAVGVSLVAWVLVGVVAGLWLLAAVTGLCPGCEVYLLLSRLGGRPDARAALGLTGPGPWLVLLGAPGCPSCEQAALRLGQEAGSRPVVEVDLAERLAAGRLAVRSIPAALAVSADGELLASRSRPWEPEDARAAVDALGGRDDALPGGEDGPLYSPSGQPAGETDKDSHLHDDRP